MYLAFFLQFWLLHFQKHTHMLMPNFEIFLHSGPQWGEGGHLYYYLYYILQRVEKRMEFIIQPQPCRLPQIVHILYLKWGMPPRDSEEQQLKIQWNQAAGTIQCCAHFNEEQRNAARCHLNVMQFTAVQTSLQCNLVQFSANSVQRCHLPRSILAPPYLHPTGRAAKISTLSKWILACQTLIWWHKLDFWSYQQWFFQRRFLLWSIVQLYEMATYQERYLSQLFRREI